MKGSFLLWFLVLWPCTIKAEVILVVESYHAEYLWDKSYKKGLRETLGSQHQLFYYEMDTKRLPESEYQNRADAAWKTYKAIAPDLVILADDNALKYLGHKFVNTQVPVVYLGINANPRAYGVVRAQNISGVLERPLLRRSILMLDKIFPIKNVLLLLDSKETSKVIKADIFENYDSIRLEDINVDVKLVSRFDDWQQHVSGAKHAGYDVLIAALYHTLTDKSGTHVPASDVINWTSQNTPIPSFGFWDFSIGPNRNIGGYVISGYEQGKAAGEIALQMLAGKKRVRPHSQGEGLYLFSRSQLQRWKIKLPADIEGKARYVD